MQTSYMWDKYMRHYGCKSFYTEPYNPQQNPAERGISHVKNLLDKMMMVSGCDERAWFKLMQLIEGIWNHTAKESLGWKTPFEVKNGFTPDISPYILFQFWEEIYYLDPRADKPGEKEKAGRWLGIAEGQGVGLCFYVLNEETDQILVRGTVRSAKENKKKKKRVTFADEIEKENNE